MTAPLATKNRMEEEGLLITLSAVRMSVKNSIIVTALRENVNFMEADYGAAAREQLISLSEQNSQDAKRVEIERKRLMKYKWSEGFSDDDRGDLVLLRRRRKVYERLAVVLLEVAEDPEMIENIVAEAQADAADEIGEAISAQLIAQAVVAADPDYEAQREQRMKDLVDINLAILADKRADTY